MNKKNIEELEKYLLDFLDTTIINLSTTNVELMKTIVNDVYAICDGEVLSPKERLKYIYNLVKTKNEITLKSVIKHLYNYAGEHFYSALKKKTTNNKVMQKILKNQTKTVSKMFRDIAPENLVLVLGGQQQTLDNAYCNLIKEATLLSHIGAIDTQTAINKIVKELGGSGGVKVMRGNNAIRVDTVVRQIVLDSSHEVAQQVQFEVGKQLKCDGVEITAHGICADDHLRVQGKIFTNAEFEKINSKLHRKIGTHNCRHMIMPVILKNHVPRYTTKELEAINEASTKNIEIAGKNYTRYEATQLQRQIETKLRYAKEALEIYKTNEDKTMATKQQKYITVLNKQYTEVCKVADLTKRPKRTQIVK
ncbi:MAG: hypothetical protein ATN36_06565 [Epulopiscium sp. Nele67-Bin005]|nr:MAG: hypothetical protein ATN36_06565 [Epulopiscium sp. Nele67-Bin005]